MYETRALRESEARFRAVVETLQEGFALYDAEDRLVLLNDEYRRLHPGAEDILVPGMHFEDLVRCNIERGTNADAIGREEEHIRERLEQHRDPKGPIVRRLTNGTWFIIKEARTPDGGTTVTETDITEFKRAEQALAEQSMLLETTFESISQGIVVYDKDLRVTAFNRKYVDLCGFPPDFVRLGMPIEKVIRFRAERGDYGPVTDIDALVREHIQARRQGGIAKRERTGSDGTEVVVTRDTMPNGGYVTTFTDITDIKRVEEALRASEERIRTVIDNMVDGIIVIDDLGRITTVNPAGERMFGYRREELLGRNVSMLMGDADTKRHQSFIHRYLRTGEGKIVGIGPREVTGRHKEGTTFPMDLAVGEIRMGIKRLFVITTRDMTDRKKAEAERAEMETQIRHLQKLEAIGTLTGGIAHEFNNLLLPMLTLTELAMDEFPRKHPARDNLEKVLTAGSRAKFLVQQISAYSRDKEPPQGPVELQPLVEETLGLLRTTLPATVEIRVDLDASGARVCADPSQIHQILMNLSSNAADALDGKVGKLEFRLEKCVVKTPSGKHREHVKLVIQDNGSGMDKKTVERIFDPFYTTKEVGSGTGMGLAIVDSIVVGFGGMIEVKSEPGQGTAFEILLPLWTDDEETDAVGAKPDEPGLRGNAEMTTVQG